jgi:NTE family protein
MTRDRKLSKTLSLIVNILVMVRWSFIVLIGIFSSSTAQPYRNLVLEGAGARGVAYVGAIKVLEEKHLLAGIEKVGGTSAGAIAALAICLGYNSKELEDIIYHTKIQKFNDGKFLFIGGISRLNKNYGWYRGKAFASWLEKIIAAKTGNADITFQELHDKKFKDLYVTGTSLNNQKLIIFSNETYPEMKVRDAVRISMSIPLYFEAVFIDPKGKVIDKRQAKGNFEIMVDGGLTGNFPISIFDSLSFSTGKEARFANPNTIGLRIDTPEQIGYDMRRKGLAPIPVYRFRNYVGSFYSYILENLNRHNLTENDWTRTASISSGDVGPRIKKMSVEKKNMLIANGSEAMQKFLK